MAFRDIGPGEVIAIDRPTIRFLDKENVKTESCVENKFGLGTWKFGNFGPTDPEIMKCTGLKNYNVYVNLYDGRWQSRGVVSDDGCTLTLRTMEKEVNSFKKLTVQEYEEFKNSADPFDAPTCHYKIQPKFTDGKLLWISGAPGSGKSTTGLYLSRKAGYVYYEADCFAYHANPYIPVDVEEPSIAILNQKSLKNISSTRIDAVNAVGDGFKKLMEGQELDVTNTEKYYSALCKDIISEKRRIGGNWVVAQAVPTKNLRKHIKKELGNGVIFILLNVLEDDRLRFFRSRHGAGAVLYKSLVKIYDRFEPAAEDEKDVITINVFEDMTPDQLVDRILASV